MWIILLLMGIPHPSEKTHKGIPFLVEISLFEGKLQIPFLWILEVY